MSDKAVVFDLDQTLVDSSSLLTLRTRREWQQVYERIPECSKYDGIDQMMECLQDFEVKTAVVTSSPRPYANRVIDHFQLKIDTLVAFHDTRLRKPHPAPIIHALQKLGVSNNRAASVGDDPGDILASNAAKVYSVAAMWGCSDPPAVLQAEPDAIADSVQQLLEILLSHFGLTN